MGTYYKGQPFEVRALSAYLKLVRAVSSVSGRLQRRLEGLGLTENQLGILEMLLHLGPLCQKSMSEKLFTSEGNMTLLVDALEKRTWVKRIRSVEDRRYIQVQLTSKGEAFITRTFPTQVDHIVEEFSVLDPAEQDELGRLCKKLGKPGMKKAS